MRVVVASMLLLVLGAILAACAPTDTKTDQAFVKETLDWHAKRIERLKGESGWLTLVGLHWLEPGENRFGSAADNPVALPEGKAPAVAGSFVLGNGQVRVTAAPDAGLTIEGTPVTERVLRSDLDEHTDVMKLGDLSLVVIRRGERFGIRVKDPASPVRLGFKGIETFPPDSAWRVTADWTAYDEPRKVEIPTVLGTVETQLAPGLATFTVGGKTCSLEPVMESPDDRQLFFIFKDGTSGRETYPAGRFLYAALPKDGKVVVDFNRAYNPPCAFTPYATCPLPPKKNWLAVRVEAGEKTFSTH